MIVDRLENAAHYSALHPGFAAAFAFLQNGGWQTLEPGRHTLDGERLWVNMIAKPGKGRAGAPLEIHRDYIDIQFTIDGIDEIGWEATDRCTQPKGEFSVEKDIQFFADTPATYVTIGAGSFAIFFPWDAHAPMASEGDIRKAVVKIAVEWEKA